MRHPRIQAEGMTFHITCRGVRRLTLFHDRLDRSRLLGLVGDAVERCEWVCLAYCLMSNHFHLVVRLRSGTLSRGMHLINSRYARKFNDRYDLTGHVFEARFAAVEITTEAHLLEALRYVSLNPVRAHLCADPAEWEWSSFRSTVGLARPPSFLAVDEARASFPGSTVREQRNRYARFVRDALPAPKIVRA